MVMPIWVFAVFIVLFAGILFWERHAYRELQEDRDGIAFFLDLYISKYGPTIAMDVSGEVMRDNDIDK